MHENEIVQVYAAADLTEAHFLRNMLADGGIEARVVGERTSTLGLPVGEEAAPCLWVHQRDEETARQLLVQWEKTRAKPRPSPKSGGGWTCTVCGERVDDEFELCWNCQNPRKPY